MPNNLPDLEVHKRGGRSGTRRVATTDGSRGFQPTVGRPPQGTRRVATVEHAVAADGSGFKRRDATPHIFGPVIRGLKPTATVMRSLRDRTCRVATTSLMANTYTSLHYHLVFSTRNRERWILPDIEQRVWAYLGGIAKENKMFPIQIGGMEDHVHLLLSASPTLAPSKIAQLIKGGSSAWIHDTFPTMYAFAWQDGYGAFSVSRSNMEEVAAYIRRQRQHHQGKTFQEEYLAFLQKHGVQYDEKFLWD